MKTYFDDLRLIERTAFLNRFLEHITHRGDGQDFFERRIFENFQQSDLITYYLGTLNTLGLSRLILPHHAVELEPGRNPDRPVKNGGDAFDNVIKSYKEDFVPNSRFPDCVKKISEQQLHFFNNKDMVLKANFLIVCNDRDYAHPGHYHDTHGENRIYLTNGFHRFVAYGLWISQNGFKPLEVHYAELPQ